MKINFDINNQELQKIENQLSLRKKNQLSPFLNHHSKNDTIIFAGLSDSGVYRNGGRKGARFAPKAIKACLSKLQWERAQIYWHEVNLQEKEQQNFNQSQIDYSEQIDTIISKDHENPIIHIGGGHDHIYPLLFSLEKNFNYSKTLVFNFDAHLDTRTDEYCHSGTPFRQFSANSKKEFSLIQFGIQEFSNHASNFDELPNGKMEVVFESIDKYSEKISQKIQNVCENEKGALKIFSLDCDALNSSNMEAVSATNPLGFLSREIKNSLNIYLSEINHPPIIGIYEYNPLYDNLSQKGAKFLASLIYQTIHFNKG